MRIAFVGKGGSGKTTLSALFAQYISRKYPVLAIDGDLNMHLGPLLGFPELPPEKHISHPAATKTIKTHLQGKNDRIKELIHFRKTTPPTPGSNFVAIHNSQDPVVVEFGLRNRNISFLTVGTYDTEEIGAGCYHNNLAILENVLSHLIDTKGVAVVDMVAGVDAFANTLHAQFDLLVLVVEPTKRGLEVFKQYKELSQGAGVHDALFVIGNKVRSEDDEEFLRKHIPPEKLLGILRESQYLRDKDREGGSLEVEKLETENRELLQTIAKKLFSIMPDCQKRLENLFELHRKYVGQASITERFGDLTNQIDPLFNLRKFIEEYDRDTS
ncbi:MAG: ATP-binding protein [Patescibacteria group bacterium]